MEVLARVAADPPSSSFRHWTRLRENDTKPCTTVLPSRESQDAGEHGKQLTDFQASAMAVPPRRTSPVALALISWISWEYVR
jgi:hypothetical protein